MARELPIRNGRLTTDLDADGHRINNLAGGGTFEQEQADWGETDSTKPSFIKRKPTIPAPVTIDSALSATSENPVQNKVVKAALDGKMSRAEIAAGFTEWVVERDGVDVTSQIVMPPHYEGVNTWIVEDSLVAGDELPANPGLFALPDAVELSWESGDGVHAYTAARAKLRPTKTSELTNDSGFLTQHQDVSGKEDKSNKVTALSSQSTDEQYPSAKCVYDALEAKPELVTSTPPVMDGVADIGVMLVAARGDHRHPSDTSKQDKYPFIEATVANGELTLQDAKVQTWTPSAGASATIVAAAYVTGAPVRDMELVIDCSSLTEGDEPTVTWDTHFHPRTDAGTDFACVAGAKNVYYISEYATDEFAVGGWTETAGGNV